MTESGMSKRWERLVLMFAAMGFLAATISCHTPRKAIVQPLKEQGPEYLFAQMKKNEVKFNTFSAKFTADAEVDRNNQTFSGIVYIERDSLIWMTISKFGIEVARFKITPDSAKMISRMTDSYFIGPFDYVCKLLEVDFDFDMLQSLVIGNDFSYYDNDVFKASVDNKFYKLSTIGRRKLKKSVGQADPDDRLLIQDLWLDPDNFKIMKSSIRETKQINRRLETQYSGFELIDEQKVPTELKFEVVDEKRKFKISILYDRITLNQKEVRGFSIPAGFKRIEK
jgi:hypothetical protein